MRKDNTLVFDLNDELNSIPEKLFYSVGEVAKYCDLDTHTLRFWEKEFPQLKPQRRNSVGSENTRRYYRREDIALIKIIKKLRYDEGYTIPGVKQKLKKLNLLEEKLSATTEDAADYIEGYKYSITSDVKQIIVSVINEIKMLLKMLKSRSS